MPDPFRTYAVMSLHSFLFFVMYEMPLLFWKYSGVFFWCLHHGFKFKDYFFIVD